jgi:hypothetical protein
MEKYYLINLCKTTREQFFKQEFNADYDNNSESVIMNGVLHYVDRITINGEQFLIKDHEVVKVYTINE